MHTRTFSRLISLALATLLIGCAAKEVPFDAANGPPVKTIGLLTPAMPSGPSVILASTVGQSFGTIGALVDLGLKADREHKLSVVLDGEHFDATKTITEDLTAALEAQHYRVLVVPTERKKDDLLDHYPASDGQIDAYLDIAVQDYGFLSAGIGSSEPYRPHVFLHCKLVRASGSALLMQDNVMYNPLGNPDKMVTIAPDPAYAFVDNATLDAVPSKTRAALESALVKTSESVAALLR